MVHAQHHCIGVSSICFFYFEYLLRGWYFTCISKSYTRHLIVMIFFWSLVATVFLLLVEFGVDNQFLHQQDHVAEWEGDSLAVLQGIFFF